MEYISLPNGLKMPILGLGMWLSTNENELIKALDAALDAGYRHFDTAYVYNNEAVLGKVMKKWISSGKVKREELFITTKLPVNGIKVDKVAYFLEKSLNSLQLDYVDLYLIHVPFGLNSPNDDVPIHVQDGQVVVDNTDLIAVWKAMEEQVNKGKVKSIGISNCDEDQLERIVQIAKIRPANLQVELHAYFQQKSLRATCAKHGISICAYSPLGAPGGAAFYDRVGVKYYPSNMLSDKTVCQIAPRHGKTVAQVLLRFLVQQGIIVIPKSTNSYRLKENIDVFDFKLSSDEMKALEALDKGSSGRTLDFARIMPGVEKHPEFPKNMRR